MNKLLIFGIISLSSIFMAVYGYAYMPMYSKGMIGGGYGGYGMGMGMGMGGGGGFGMGGGIGGFLIFSKFTHTCRLHFHILINWTRPFLILGLLGGIFHFYSKFMLFLPCFCYAF